MEVAGRMYAVKNITLMLFIAAIACLYVPHQVLAAEITVNTTPYDLSLVLPDGFSQDGAPAILNHEYVLAYTNPSTGVRCKIAVAADVRLNINTEDLEEPYPNPWWTMLADKGSIKNTRVQTQSAKEFTVSGNQNYTVFLVILRKDRQYTLSVIGAAQDRAVVRSVYEQVKQSIMFR
jgi:hypothetical protein